MFGKKKSGSSGGSSKIKNKKRSGSYLDASKKKRQKYLMILIPIIVAVVAILAISGSRFSSEINKFGTVGSAHEHAAFIINVNGTAIDFSQPQYQVKSRLIHVEGGDGFTLHRHTDRVPFGEFLRSENMNLEDSCFSISEGTSDQQGQQQGQQLEYCTNETEELRAFVNGEELEPPSALVDYILKDDDRILLIYGNQTTDQLTEALSELEEVPILKT
ncbi:MAG TPA: hypothetical protein VE504_06505 [Nitrososphaeraceae archaeon]|nr:hypothetical protein [Nitrososphaeraceae archaeon]